MGCPGGRDFDIARYDHICESCGKDFSCLMAERRLCLDCEHKLLLTPGEYWLFEKLLPCYVCWTDALGKVISSEEYRRRLEVHIDAGEIYR